MLLLLNIITWSHLVHQTTTQISLGELCPYYPGTVKLHPKYPCQAYYDCRVGYGNDLEWRINYCLPSEFPDLATGQCVPGYCRPPRPGDLCLEEFEILLDHNNCRKFLRCEGRPLHLVQYQCPPFYASTIGFACLLGRCEDFVPRHAEPCVTYLETELDPQDCGRYFLCTLWVVGNGYELRWKEYRCPFGQKYNLGYKRCVIGNCEDDSDSNSESNEITITHKPIIITTPKNHNMTTSHPTEITTPRSSTPTSTKPNGTTPKTTPRTTMSTIKTSTLKPVNGTIRPTFTAKDCKENAKPEGPRLFPHHICYRYYECILQPSGKWSVKGRRCPSDGRFMFVRQKCRTGNCILYP